MHIYCGCCSVIKALEVDRSKGYRTSVVAGKRWHVLIELDRMHFFSFPTGSTFGRRWTLELAVSSISMCVPDTKPREERSGRGSVLTQSVRADVP